jgi:hypothetical protein
MQTWRGVITTVLGTLFALLIVGGQVVTLLTAADGPPPSHAAAVQSYGLILFVFTLSAVLMAEAPFFWPPEVTFLFPAPLGRRETMAYLFVSRGWVQALSGVYFALLSIRLAPLKYAPFVAVPLGMLFINAAAMLTAQLRIAVGDRTPLWIRRGIKPVLGAGAVLLLVSLYRRAQVVGGGNAAAEFLASPGLKAAPLPLRPFAETFSATSALAVLGWGAAAALTVAVTVAAALQVPVDYRERSLVSSERRYARLRRMRARRGGAVAAGPPRNRRLPVPPLAFLGRAAPLARRHLYELGRGLNALFGLAVFGALTFFYAVILPGLGRDSGDDGPLAASLMALVVVYPLLASNNFTLDFRREGDRMAYLRSLPLAPSAVALGEIFTAALVIGIANLLLLGTAVAWAGGDVDSLLVTVAAVIALPVAWLAVAMENWLFLLFPVRVSGDGTVQSGFAAKQILKMLLKLFVLALLGGAAGGAAWVTALAAGRIAGAAAAALVVIAGCAGFTLLVGRAFLSFDLTVDAPD